MVNDDRTRIAPAPIQAGVGTQLSGIYELDEKLAAGGMGEVWRGHNIQTGDSVAIKIVLPEFARDETIRQLFLKEARILGRLSHEAIVRYHLFTVDPAIGRPYLAMEFVEGESLFDVMERGPLPSADVRRLCVRLADALAAVHTAHVFHRDLSPDNIILPGGRVERAIIIDFGIARSARLGDATLLGGRFAGKYNYVSPEQLGLFGGEITERSDIYSLGLVLAAALLGRPIDMSGSQADVVEKRRRLPDLSGIAPDFRPLLSAMLQPDPKDRPRSMDEIVELARFSGDVPETGSDPARSATVGLETSKTPSPIAGSPGFVPHRSPVLPPKPGPAPTSAGRRRAGLPLAIASFAILLAAGSSAYLAGLLPFGPPADIEQDQPAQVPPPADDPEVSADQPRESGPAAPAETEEASAGPSGVGSGQQHSEIAKGRVDEEVSPPIEEREEVDETPLPAQALDEVAQRIAWLRDFPGGECFYATATTATDKAIEIEGFGTEVEPFAEMMSAFQARFGIEPEVGVRRIDPAQCPVTGFLRELGRSGEEAPQLTLASSSVANGAKLSGTLEVTPGGAFHLFLIDHKGIAFSLDKRLEKHAGGAGFEIPIALSAADRAKAASVPQVILAVTSSGGSLESAAIDRPMPAAEVLAAIAAEAKARDIGTAATAKFFKLGG